MAIVEKILRRPDLVGQKSPHLENVQLVTTAGEQMPIARDGCAIVSLYNALRIYD